VSNHSTPQGSGAATPDNHSIIDTVSEQDEGTMTPPSKQTTPTTSPRNSLRYRTIFALMKKINIVRIDVKCSFVHIVAWLK